MGGWYLEAEPSEGVGHEDPVEAAALPLGQAEASVEHVILKDEAETAGTTGHMVDIVLEGRGITKSSSTSLTSRMVVAASSCSSSSLSSCFSPPKTFTSTNTWHMPCHGRNILLHVISF